MLRLRGQELVQGLGYEIEPRSTRLPHLKLKLHHFTVYYKL